MRVFTRVIQIVRSLFQPQPRIHWFGKRVDLGKTAERLQVKEKGIQEARHNRPPATAQHPDVAEQEMVDSFCQEKHQLTAIYGTDLDQEQQTQVQLGAQWALERFEECRETLGHALHMLRVTSRGVLESLWQDWRAAERALNAFRQEHGVTRAAVYPESHLWPSAVLIGLAFVEALANMVFFARGAEGLLGGLLESLVVAAVNIATAFCAGIAIRGVHSPSLMQRFLAGVVGLGYVAFLGSFHLAVAHYRIALVLDAEKAATVAMTRLMQQPWALADIHSCLLLTIGLLGAAIAFIDAYKFFDDPLPGYGAVSRRRKAAKAAYESLKHQHLTDIQTLTDAHLSQVDTRFDEATAAMMAYRASVATTKRLIREYQEMITALAEACRALQRMYRDTNSAVRTDPDPGYYAEEPPLPFQPDPSIWEIGAIAEAEHIIMDPRVELPQLQQQVTETKQGMRTRCATSLQNAEAFFAQIENVTPPPVGHRVDGVGVPGTIA